MGVRVQSALKEGEGRNLHSKYEEIYQDQDLWLYPRIQGLHTLLVSLLESRLTGSEVLDIGCGAGRLSVMSAQRAASVEGFDFSETAISIARKVAEVTETANVHFEKTTIEQFQSQKKFDVIFLIGVLEHVPEPRQTLETIREYLKKEGLFVVACPNFLNFRGTVYKTLLEAFHWPMSLADLRQIGPQEMEEWERQVGLERIGLVGALYHSAWTEKAVADLKKRIPLAIQDAKFSLPFDDEALGRWMDSQAAIYRPYLDDLRRNGILKEMIKPFSLSFKQEGSVEKAFLEKIRQYLNDDFSKEPYFCDIPPFNAQGGEAIYLLRKRVM